MDAEPEGMEYFLTTDHTEHTEKDKYKIQDKQDYTLMLLLISINEPMKYLTL